MICKPRTYLTSGYQGTLGYGYPTALGVQVGNPDRKVVFPREYAPGDPLRRVPMMEPLRGTAQHVASLIDQSASAAELLERLGT